MHCTALDYNLFISSANCTAQKKVIEDWVYGRNYEYKKASSVSIKYKSSIIHYVKAHQRKSGDSYCMKVV